MLRTLIIASAGLLCLAANAPAATITSETVSVSRYDPPRTIFTWRAAPGETNVLDASYESGSAGDWRVTFRDTGAPIAAGPCRAVSITTASCASGQAAVYLGDGDDRADVRRGTAEIVMGEDGDDTILGDRGSGGTGDDTLLARGNSLMGGGAGSDRMIGTKGRDWFSPDDDSVGGLVGPASSSRDVAEGGAGDDTVSYFNGDPITVDLAAGRSVVSRTGITDTITGFESVFTGSGSDTVLGTGGANHLETGSGRDVIRAGGDDDMLDGGDGPDALDAGPGSDEIDAYDDNRTADRIDCGPGRDHVRTGDENDLWVPSVDVLDDDCETVEVDLGTVPVVPRGLRAGRRAVVPARCYADAPATCRVTVTLALDGRRIGSRTLTTRAGVLRTDVAVPLSGSRPVGILRITTSVRSGGGKTEHFGYRVDLRRIR